MKTKSNYKTNLKMRYRRTYEISLVISLFICNVIFQGFKKFTRQDTEASISGIHIFDAIETPPLTKQDKIPQQPSRPLIPIPSEDEGIPPDETISSTEWNFENIKNPPKFVEENTVNNVFFEFHTNPEPVEGFTAIQKNLVYPEIARIAGVEGLVVVRVHIDEKGEIINFKVIKSLGNNGCDEAAVTAIKSVKWKPALQRDIPVKVWISIPIMFRLK